MFNYGVYKRQMTLNKSIEKIKKEYLDDREKRRGTNQKMSQNYRKRVENFVINMLENPIPTTEYQGPTAHQIRDERPEKFIGDAQIYVKGFKYEKERIQEALEKNTYLDFLPNTGVAAHQFRMRDVDKEIHPDMRFKDKTSLERIEQFLKDHTQTQVENMDFNKNKKALKFDTLSESMSVQEKRAFIARQIAKNLLPSLHHKTHFQATQILFNNLPLSMCDNGRSLPTLKSPVQGDNAELSDFDVKSPTDAKKPKTKKDSQRDINSDDPTLDKQKSKGDQLETFNPIETSKQVLQSCQIIKKKNPKVRMMHQGDGHLISTLDRSISEMYMELYNIDLSKHDKNGFHFTKHPTTLHN